MGTGTLRSSSASKAVGSWLAWSLALGAIGMGGGLAACSQGGGSAAGPRVAVAPPPPEALHLVPIGGEHPSREGSAVALAHLGARTVAIVADEDDSVLHVVDVDRSEELSTTRLGGKPAQLVIGPSGKIYVTLRDKDAVEVLEATGKLDASLVSVARIAAESEPLGIALTPDGSKVVVASGWGHALTVHDATTGARTARVQLARDPRSVVVSDDGTKAFVSHVVGARLSVVDLRTASALVHETFLGERDPRGVKPPRSEAPSKRARPPSKERRIPRPMAAPAPLDETSKTQLVAAPAVAVEKDMRIGCQGFALAKSVAPSGRILAPQVLVDPGHTEERSSGYGSGGSLPTEISSIAVVDEGTGEPLEASLEVPQGHTGDDSDDACVLPRAAAVSAKTHSLFVACLGLDAVVEYDAASIDPRTSERRRFAVAAGPVGIAIDPGDGTPEGEHSRSRAVVWSQFERTLNVIDLDSPSARTTRVALMRRAAAPTRFDLALGRKLFHASGDARIASDGRACASCHPDGRDDSITWATPDGPRQTPMLVGRLSGTAPYGWGGNGKSIHAHVKQTFQRLRGSGLPQNETDALLAYVASLAPPTIAAVAPDPNALALVTRGRAIFNSSEAECASCHTGRASADGEKHGVASKTPADVIDIFDTPSLRFIGGTAPYFHDGRYATLRELLTSSDGLMGRTSQLSPSDLDALEAYLRSL